MRYVLLTLVLSIGYVFGIAQSYVLDPTFQPFFNIGPGQGVSSGIVSDVYEDAINGKLYIGSDFNQSFNNQSYNGYVCVFRNGSYYNGFQGQALGISGLKYFQRLNDSTLVLLQSNGIYMQIDTLGNQFNLSWAINLRQNLRCKEYHRPYFFADGSMLVVNSAPGSNPNACDITTPTDTFPYQSVVMTDPSGNYDSTFQRKAVFLEPRAIIPYDSQRVFLIGLPGRFKTYDSVLVNGVARVFLDGSLDTTFISPVLDTSVLLTANYPEITPIENSNKVFLHGLFFLKETRRQHNLVRLHANGSIDTTFNYNNGPTHSLHNYHEVRSIVPTDDGGYLISGTFDSIQGYPKNNLAKIDSNGNVEPQYFTSRGPDSSYQIGNGWAVVNIEKSALGGYYVYGDFSTWNGRPSQPIVRINGLITGIEEFDPTSNSKNSIIIYPNPNRDGFFNIKSEIALKSIQLLDINARFIREYNPSQQQYELPSSSGIYLLRLERVDGRIIHEKVIRE